MHPDSKITLSGVGTTAAMAKDQNFHSGQQCLYAGDFNNIKSNFGFGPEAPMYMAFDDSYHNAEEDEENGTEELYEERYRRLRLMGTRL